MNYSIEALEALVADVEHQGGAVLPDACLPQDVAFRKKDGYKRDRLHRNITCGCGNETRMTSIYDPGDTKQAGSGYITACAVCDSMGAWPRYREAVIEADPDLDLTDDENDGYFEDDE